MATFIPLVRSSWSTGVWVAVGILFGACFGDAVIEPSTTSLALSSSSTSSSETPSPEVVTPDPPSVEILGSLPDGTRYRVSFDPAFDVGDPQGIHAAIKIAYDPGSPEAESLSGLLGCEVCAPVIGVTTFVSDEQLEEPRYLGGLGLFQIPSGDWTMNVDLYDFVLDLWGDEVEQNLRESIMPIPTDTGMPAFRLLPPLHWATDVEIPKQMQVVYEDFVVRRGCGDIQVACDENGRIQVIPTEAVVTPAPEWDHDRRVVIHGLPVIPIQRNVRARWTRADVGAPSSLGSGRLLLVDQARVYLAGGFGVSDQIVALSTESGEVVWRRGDLWTDEDDVFLQAVSGDTLIANGQYHHLLAMDASSGVTNWSHSLPQGYGIESSVIADGLLVAVASAGAEGDLRPPIVIGLSVDDGTWHWETALAEGMDANWTFPAVAGEVVAVASTESHRGSSPSGNMVHLLDVSTGEILWVNHLGGGQGFHTYPLLIDDKRVVVWYSGGNIGFMAVLDVTTGDRIWRTEDRPLTYGPDGAIYAARDGIVRIDPDTGEASPFVDAEALGGLQVGGASIQDAHLVVFGGTGLRGIDLATGQIHWSIDYASGVGFPASTADFVVVPTEDLTVTLFDLP